MDQSTWWWIAALVLLILELLSGTFYLLMLALGMTAAALGAHAGAGLSIQILLAAGVGAGAAGAWHFARRARVPGPADDLHLDVGHVLHIPELTPDSEGSVRYRGASWTAVLKEGSEPAEDGRYRVSAIEGSRLVVEPAPRA